MSANEKQEKRKRYGYLRLPLAAPADAAKRREFLIQSGVIIPATENYACGHPEPVVTAACPTCGNTTVVWQ